MPGKGPSDRPATAGELLASLDTITTPSGTMRAGERANRSRVYAIGFIALVIIVAAVMFVRTRNAASPQLEPKRVVVATFENKSGDKSLDPLGVMATDWIARGLANTGMVDVGGTAAELAARGVRSATSDGATPLMALARDAKAGIVISGAYYRSGDSVLFQADFTDANAGRLILSVGPVSASTASPLDGIERLQQRVMGGLAPLVDSTLVGLATATSRPPNIEAYREFLAGEELFYKDGRASMPHYARAASLDSSYVIPLIRLIAAYDNTSDGPMVDSIARVLERRRALLTPYEQAYLEFGTCRMRADADGCLPASSTMARLAPRSPFAAYMHAIGERWSGHAHAADSILSTLDPEGGALRGRIFFFAHGTAALHTLGS